MSKQDAKLFLEQVEADSALRATLDAANWSAEVVAAEAVRRDLAVTADDLRGIAGELSDEQLDGVVGGSGGFQRFLWDPDREDENP